MSGILALISTDAAPIDGALVERLTGRMSFRGPDAQNTWADGPVALGHALLRNSLFPHERQPLSLDGQVWIIADARIDARRELIAQLQRGGCDVSADAAPAELILNSYHLWGEHCVEHIMGDFAFIVWDGANRQLFCGRDQFGVKQFFYAKAGAQLILSNTLDCIRAHPLISSALNEHAIGDFLLTDVPHQPPSATFYQDIHALPPAHTLTWRDGELRLRQFWRVPQPETLRYRREQEYVEHFRSILADAVADRVREESVGIAFSGGMDSSAIVALANQARIAAGMPHGLNAYMVDMRPLVPDTDPPYAQKLADACGVPLHFKRLEDYQLFDEWKDSARKTPAPENGNFIIQQVLLLQEMSSKTRVGLNGQFADTALFPWRSYLLELLRDLKWGTFAAEVFGYWRSHGRLPPLWFRRALRGRFERIDFSVGYPTWLNPEFESRLDLKTRWRELVLDERELMLTPPQYYERAMHGHRLTYQLYFDPGFTGVPVESRSPFADVRVANFVLALPPLPWRINKELLRRAMEGLVPDEVRLRPKSSVTDTSRALLARSDGWWLAVLDHTPQIAEYVDVGKVKALLTSPDALARVPVSPNLRPVSLAFWLQRQ